MADKILHYEVTKGYGKAKEGLRFDVVRKGSEGPDESVNKGLMEALGVTHSEASTIRCNIKYEEI
jgi:hypothetical protein